MATFIHDGSEVVLNEPVSNVTLTNSVLPGVQRCDDAGNRYVYVYNAGPVQISQGQFAVIATGASGYSVTASNATAYDIGVGVARNATIATAGYGWLMQKGFTGISTDNMSFAVQQCLLLGVNGNFGASTSTAASFVSATIVGKALAVVAKQVTCSTAAALNACFVNML
jgi:hypothetical protein